MNNKKVQVINGDLAIKKYQIEKRGKAVLNFVKNNYKTLATTTGFIVGGYMIASIAKRL